MIKCAKLNGNGNDFIAIDNMKLEYNTEKLRDFAVSACRRRESVGGDGILVAEPSSERDFKMRIFNSDGSEGEMCGNGARCLSRFVFENNIVTKPDMVFETLSGSVRASVNGAMVRLWLSTVDLTDVRLGVPAVLPGFEFEYTFLTVGVPHTVIFQNERRMSDDEYRQLGRQVRYMTELFPEGANIDFVFPRDAADELFVLTYERGVEDLTLSCGTGSTAAAIAAAISGKTGKNVDVWNPGGLNKVSLDFAADRTVLPTLEGAVKYVGDLYLRDEALK